MPTPAETVRKFIAALERKDLEAAVTLLADECEYDNVPMAKVHGPAAVRAVLEPFLAGCARIEWVVHREAATGSIVFNERTDRFEMAHGWVEIAVTGVWEVSGGRITLWRDYFDLATFRAQMQPAAPVGGAP